MRSGCESRRADKIISAWTQSRDAFAVRDQLQKAGIPCGVAQTGEDLVNDPHQSNALHVGWITIG
jgi:crotonobetainyl-CoA:carnitine CoA-transferase CaiB-like acyl-CoA transferase